MCIDSIFLTSPFPRFYEPQEGAIYFEGEDIRSIDIEELRSRVAIVDQNPSLFAMSIHENIKVGNIKGMVDRELRNCSKFLALWSKLKNRHY